MKIADLDICNQILDFRDYTNISNLKKLYEKSG